MNNQLFGYLYETRNKVNNHWYISIHGADKFNPKYIGSGTRLQHAIKKYSKEAFEVRVITWMETDEELGLLEMIAIAWYREKYGVDAVYNLAVGGYREAGSSRGWRATPETRARMSAAQKGRIITDEMKRKISLTLTGRKASEESKRKRKEACKGKLSPFAGRRHSIESKAKTSLTGKKRWAAYRLDNHPHNVGSVSEVDCMVAV